MFVVMWINVNSLKMLTRILLTATMVGLVQLDCGCNKLQRDDTENLNINAKNGDQTKICDANAVKNNKYYRDYYSEQAGDEHNEVERDEPGMSFIPGGDVFIGTNEPNFVEDHESPERMVVLKDFFIDKYEVSNIEFKKFVDATQYKTDAEKFGDSFVFKTLLTEEQQKKYEDFRASQALWWYKIKGVSWQHPSGSNSDLKGIWDHPVVHVSWHDAVAYCKWAGKRLPTEDEWEATCRGGRKGKLFPWGNKLMPHNKHWVNIWQGDFPDSNTQDDGYVTTCPVDKFRQNNYDVYNIVGNVWEWTQDLWDKRDKGKTNPNRVKKGGSYMCHEVYCYRYRCAARSQNTEDSSAGNLGFRCAKNY